MQTSDTQQKFKTIHSLRLYLYTKDYLTSDAFSTPDREYIFLDGDIIKFNRLDGALEIFDFERFKEYSFRKVQRII